MKIFNIFKSRQEERLSLFIETISIVRDSISEKKPFTKKGVLMELDKLSLIAKNIQNGKYEDKPDNTNTKS